VVELVEYDPARVQRFEVEAALIARACGDTACRIEHVGSTAVPGLAGKPTVDIAVGVDSIDLPPELVERMTAAGLEHHPDPERPWEMRFVKGAGFPREVIAHVVEWEGWKWRDFLRFRDALRADPGLAAEYEQLKRALLDRGTWYRGVDKKELIERVLKQ
jgi:GrpB-like predicted nucleotidyltransferase (UPF0157 family)